MRGQLEGRPIVGPEGADACATIRRSGMVPMGGTAAVSGPSPIDGG